MKRIIIYIVFLFFSSNLFAQEASLLFEKANKVYRNGDYQQALKDYKKIESLGMQSADLYYNTGNTYYKLNQIAPSIYYFEKALLLDSNHQDAKHNLIYAQRMTIDAFESLPKTVFQKINEQLIYPIHYNKWAWMSVVLAILFSIFFLMYYYAGFTTKKRLFFTLSLLSFFLFLITLSFTLKAKHYADTNQPAIVFSSKVSIKSEPIVSAGEVFEIHEGTKVQVLEQIDDWSKIKLIDGKIGWLMNKDIKKIK
jgi:tetratricopeptide (TPR) repeat protein